MDFDPAATALLADLTAALDDSDLDLTAGLSELVARLRTAVPGYVGLTVLTTGRDRPFTLTSLAGEVIVGSSLSVTIGPVTLVAHASTPGALVDLAADLSWSAPDAVTVVLDQHLTVPVASSDHELSTVSAVDQAIGVLIGRGRPPAEAQRLLHAYAARAGTDVGDAAAQVLATVGPRRADDAPDAA